MWAAIEKWAVPALDISVVRRSKPAMTMGYDGELFMNAAGVIEFTLAFALIWTPLVRRMSAIHLPRLFISAVFEFGKVDAIGHSAIIVVLLAIAADGSAISRVKPRQLLLTPVGYGVALAGFLFVYYVSHAVLFGSTII